MKPISPLYIRRRLRLEVGSQATGSSVFVGRCLPFRPTIMANATLSAPSRLSCMDFRLRRVQGLYGLGLNGIAWLCFILLGAGSAQTARKEWEVLAVMCIRHPRHKNSCILRPSLRSKP